MGMRWRFGNGMHINVWQDPWITNNPNFKPTTPVIEGLEGLQVASLWVLELQCWNYDLLKALFNEQLPSILGEDKLVWHYSKDGKYTVKFGYRVACVLNNVHNSNRRSDGWHKIWKLMIPLKVKVFIWRLCWDNPPYPITTTSEKTGYPYLMCHVSE